ncbi:MULTISPECIES: hypothetical protein [Peribacillus]|uniref:Uncharacterized protein n=1 Tax=Peribacillus simplex TaxID=1478 RepID=A0A109MUI2_9BACI|nr:hypothetical protein [Peribacillus simplex]KWW15452.1 hypothetical protein AS888_07920 [Peribacillus simplex]
MKKYLFFTISFLLLFTILQVISGLILTAAYTPDFSGATPIAGSPGMVSQPQLPVMIMSALSAVMAYFISNRVMKSK